MYTLLLLAVATLVSEDLTCIAAGVMVADGRLNFWLATLTCAAGIIGGDMLLFLAGRKGGRRLLITPIFRRFISQDRVNRGSAWISQRGLIVIFLSRFTPGLRLPTYFAAGVLRTSFWQFAIYFVLAGIVWTPLLIAATILFGAPILRGILSHGIQGSLASILAIFCLYFTYRFLRLLISYAGRRRVFGFLLRKVRWEFWPPWAAYLPVFPYIIYLGIKHGCLTLFTSANPGMLAGGFIGESKSEILDPLSRAANIVAQYRLIPASAVVDVRLDLARQFMDQHSLAFPVVLKPDVGERGRGVAIVRNQDQLKVYLSGTTVDTLIQEYVAGFEVGIFYYRHPERTKGEIFSITEKRFPQVTGDGSSTLERLILSDPRAVCLAQIYLQRHPNAATWIPANGELVTLIEIGSHCRGSIFLDGGRLKTDALEAAIDRISRLHPGFFLGRFDIRTASLDALRQGESFKIIELNGVSAEPAHIYDPGVSLWAAYRALFHQWRTAFEIGAHNRAQGAAPTTMRELVELIWKSHEPGRIPSSRLDLSSLP